MSLNLALPGTLDEILAQILCREPELQYNQIVTVSFQH
jgi:hypothetical protein